MSALASDVLVTIDCPSVVGWLLIVVATVLAYHGHLADVVCPLASAGTTSVCLSAARSVFAIYNQIVDAMGFASPVHPPKDLVLSLISHSVIVIAARAALTILLLLCFFLVLSYRQPRHLSLAGKACVVGAGFSVFNLCLLTIHIVYLLAFHF